MLHAAEPGKPAPLALAAADAPTKAAPERPPQSRLLLWRKGELVTIDPGWQE